MPDKIEDIYIWKIIERMLFSPNGEKEFAKWFRQYNKFISQFLGLPISFPVKNNKKIEYSYSICNKIAFSFLTPFDLPKFSINYTQGGLSQSFHYDNKYLSELDLIDIFNAGIDKQLLHNLKQKKISYVQIQRILESMITHPALHLHLEDLSHSVRLNLNTKNPFLFLYQLAFQLLDYKADLRDSAKKQLEFKRLVEMIVENIDNQNQIASGILLNS